MILFAWRRLPPPGFIGGAEISEALVARSLVKAGHQVTFIGSTTNPRDPAESWEPWLLELLEHHGITPDDRAGHLAYRWHGVHCHAVDQDQLLGLVDQLAGSAQVLWTSQEDCPAVRAAAPHLPAASYAHSVSDVGLLSAQLGARWVFAPSRFVQTVIRDRFDVEAHLLRPPLTAATVGDVGGRDLVLFVNPIEVKGVATAIELARRLPATTFVFVESWYPAATDLDLPANVTLLNRVPTLIPLYQRSRLLIAPSVIDDACPRVILEAANHGIPALGSDRGGIPELIADPRNVLPAGDHDAWAARTAQLLQSPDDWAIAADQQQAHAKGMRADPAAWLHQLHFPADTASARR